MINSSNFHYTLSFIQKKKLQSMRQRRIFNFFIYNELYTGRVSTRSLFLTIFSQKCKL
jgi:hypothetical protein